MRQKHLIAKVVGGLVLASVGATEASLITFQFSGVITSVYEPANDFGGLVHRGDPFVVSYTFDTLTPDLVPQKPDIGWYEGPTASLVLPSITYVSTAGLNVYPYVAPAPSLTFWTPEGNQPRIFSGFSGMLLSDDKLPIGFTGSRGQLTVKAAGNLGGQFFGTIVPEPTALAMLLVGLLGLNRRR